MTRNNASRGWIGRQWPNLAACVLLSALLWGCGPGRANIKLRKENQGLKEQVEALDQQVRAERARIAGLEQQRGTVPTLPEARLGTLYTVHGIELGRLTGGGNLDESKTGDEGLKIYLTPVDEDGEPIKATGDVTVEALDLGEDNHPRIGQWRFAPGELKKTWRSLLSLHAFVLVCPWQTSPRHPNLTLHVTFRDELTGRVYSAAKDVTVNLPAGTATQPAIRP